MTATRIMIVAHDDSQRISLSNLLIRQGFEVDTAAGAHEALDGLAKADADLVILDSVVKDLTPGRLLAFLQERDQDTFVIVMAEEPELSVIMDWMLDGVFGCVAKPVRADHLLSMIAKGLENKAAYHEVVSLTGRLKEANDALMEEKAALNKKSEHIRFLFDLGTAVSATLDTREMVERVGQALSSQLRCSGLGVLWHFEEAGELRFYSDRPFPLRWVRSAGEEWRRRFLPAAPESISTMKAPSSGSGPASPPGGWETAPLIAGGRVCGLMIAAFEAALPLDEEARLLLDGSSLLTAQALYTGHQHELARNHASRDALTGLFNRRAFDESLEREFRRAQRYNAEMALIIMDLDHFKTVNDRFGHKSGDQVLKNVARVIRDSIRDTDIPARIGGEEFAIILPNTGMEKGLRLARRIQSNLRRPPAEAVDVWIKQTVSQGVADTRHPAAGNQEDLIILADRAMYLAKEEGRNRIRSAKDLNTLDSGRKAHHAGNR